MPRITVVGSLNMDFIVSVERLPAPGETVLGNQFQMLPGGKGANQACAAGKIGAPAIQTKMIGRVGYDVFADHLKASLAEAGVDAGHVHATRTQPTGVALIWVDRNGQNSIVVSPGANHSLAPSDMAGMQPVFRGSRFALFQLESPLETVELAMRLARDAGAETMLDPGPAQTLSAEVLTNVDILTPNETEALILLGLPPDRVSLADAPAIASSLRDRGPRRIVLKMGDQGCFYSDGEQDIVMPGFRVSVKDSTAAGDIFNAGLAVALTDGLPLEKALQFANAAAALSVMRTGAQASIPSRSEIARFLATH